MALTGALIGQAVGDALGFVVEGYGYDICKQYVNKIVYPQVIPTMLRLPQFKFGQYSDDTQLAREFLLSISQTEGRIDPTVYATRIAMLFQPGAYRIVGYGHQTEKAALAVRNGISHKKSGITTGNGNGSAMRSVPIGVALYDAPHEVVVKVAHELSAITHASPRTLDGAALIALTAQYAVVNANVNAHWDSEQLLTILQNYVRDAGSVEALKTLRTMLSMDFNNARSTVLQMGVNLGESMWHDGISHSVLQTVMWSLYCVCSYNNDYVKAVACAIMVGGDVDTTAAIVGGIVGARLGMDSIPSNWVACLHDINIWNADQLRDLCQQVAQYKITY